MGIKHYFAFDSKAAENMHSDSLDMENWEILRTYDEGGYFALERSRTEWIKNCEKAIDYKETAEKIKCIIEKNGWRKMASLGIGKGVLEYHLKKMCPQLALECTDYTRKSLELLKGLFEECDKFSIFDVAKDDFSVFNDCDVILMYRISTEFTKTQWNEIFYKMYTAGIKNIIFVPANLLTWDIAVKEKAHYVVNMIRHKKNIFCGWMYSRNEFLEFFSGTLGESYSLYSVISSYKKRNTEIFELKRG